MQRFCHYSFMSHFVYYCVSNIKDVHCNYRGGVTFKCMFLLSPLCVSPSQEMYIVVLTQNAEEDEVFPL